MSAELPKLIVALYLVGESLDPVEITSILKLQPSKAQKKGQEFVTASGREFTSRTGSWALVVQIESEPLDVHLKRLVDSLPISTSFAKLPGVESAFFDIFVAVGSRPTGEASCELHIPPELASDLFKFGLQVKFTFTAGPD